MIDLKPPHSSIVLAGPAARRLARELSVNLEDVHRGSTGVRITPEDVKAFAQRSTNQATDGQASPALPDFSRWGPVKRQRLTPVARTNAERVSLAWRLIPHVTQQELADITDLEALRRRFNEKNQGARANITITVLALKAVVAALKAYPQFNSSLDSTAGELIVKDYYHLGVAVATEQGLLVPVLRDVDQKTIVTLAGELADLAEKARSRSLTPGDLEGGTFTISNLGGAAFTPIVNYPEVAILGIARARWQPVTREGETRDRLLLPLTLSCDHRVINGADGDHFLGMVTALLSEPFNLLTV